MWRIIHSVLLVALVVAVGANFYMTYTTVLTSDDVRAIVVDAVAPTSGPEVMSYPELDEALLAELKSGGYVLFIRHSQRAKVDNLNMYDVGAAIPAINAPELVADGYCLTDLGQRDAEMVGRQLRYLGVEVHEVFASPTCRTKQTAEIAFKGQPVNINPSFSHVHFKFADEKGKEFIISKTWETFSRAKEGVNIAVASHGDFLRHMGMPDHGLVESGIYFIKMQADGPIIVAEAMPSTFAKLVYARAARSR